MVSLVHMNRVFRVDCGQQVSFRFKAKEEERPMDSYLTHFGFIAQDVKKLVPEAVSGVEGDLEKGETLSIAYTTLIPVLTRAIQEQNEAIEKQNKMIVMLQKEVKMLNKKVN